MTSFFIIIKFCQASRPWCEVCRNVKIASSLVRAWTDRRRQTLSPHFAVGRSLPLNHRSLRWGMSSRIWYRFAGGLTQTGWLPFCPCGRRRGAPRSKLLAQFVEPGGSYLRS